MSQLKYPGTAAYIVDNLYQNGYISTVKGTYTTTEDIFTATGYNQRGQVTGYALGNGLSTTRGYDDFGFPTTIQTPGIQDLAYQFNTQTGNLNWRKDVAKTLQESFTYDNLMKNRLETWQVNTGTIYSVGYNPNGNIENKTGLGAYDYQGLQPHAVSEVDNTGGIISPFEQNIDYTPFNKVESIMESLDGLQYTYGPDNQRKKAVVFYEHPQYTKYYSCNYEKKAGTTTQEFHYIFGGDGLAAVYITEDGTGNMYYIHKDHLGSVNCITDENGNLVEEMSFDAWGRRRNPADWTYNNVPYSYLIERGFTGHEHLDEFNLINMNGRVYDPILGRFLSPDNYIQLPDYSQSLNRYSYCLNNPLIYTDPSGDSFVLSLLATVVGGYIFGGLHNWINRDMPFKEAFAPRNNFIATELGFAPGDRSFSNPQVDAHNLVQQHAANVQSINQQIAGFSGADRESTGYGDFVINQQFVGESPLAGGVVSFGEGIDMNGLGMLRTAGEVASYGSGAIGLTQIGMMEYRSVLSIHRKVGTFSKFSSTYSSLGKFGGRLGTAGALVGIGFNINDLSTGNIGVGRFAYRTGSIGTSVGVGAMIGGPWGAAAGTAVGGISTGFEFIYDSYLVPFGQEIQYQIWNFENAIRNGWYPRR